MRFLKSVVLVGLLIFIVLSVSGVLRIVAPYLVKYFIYGFVVVIGYILGRTAYMLILKWGSNK